MTSLLAIKEKIVGFYKNYEYPVQAVGKFILALLAFNYINNELGYFESLTGIVPMLFLSLLCAVVPVAVFVLIIALVVLLHLFKLSMMLSAVALVIFLLFYFIYLKFAPDHGILIVLYPVLAQFNLHYMIPLLGAMVFNPFAALPIAFAVLFLKMITYLQEAASLGDPGTDVQGIMTSYQYIFDKLLSDKEVIAYIAIFTLVILITYAISKLSIDYAWYIAIGVGTAVNIVGLAVQASSIPGMNVGMVVIGSVIGGLLTALIHFSGCTLDYARKEQLQFEDDDFYYYVKAIPKIQITDAERTVRKTEKKRFRKKSKKQVLEEAAEEAAREIPAEMVSGDTIVPMTPEESLREERLAEETAAAEEIPAAKNSQKNDFDELSFDGFDFDELEDK